MLAEKLSEMMATFSDNRDSHYRAQLAALQADINLIMKADPYKNEPLEDNGQEASELIAQIMGNNVPTAPSAGTDYVAQCGKYYSRFVDAVNDAMEERDYNLTMLYVRCDRHSLGTRKLMVATEQAREQQDRHREFPPLQSQDRRGGTQSSRRDRSRTSQGQHSAAREQTEA